MDPWSGELRDGCVWGRGALDMKSQVAAEAAAALASRRRAGDPRPATCSCSRVDEETGRRDGALWLASTHPDSVRCDMV